MTAIRTRRSIRRYTNEPVSEEDLHTILEAGLCAPSATNRKPSHIIVVRNPETLKLLSAINSHGKMIETAPLCLAIVADTAVQANETLILNDGSALVENILLAAHGIGLGAVWIGVTPQHNFYKELSRILGLPDNIIPIALIPVGHPDEKKITGDRYEAAKIHQEIFKI